MATSTVAALAGTYFALTTLPGAHWHDTGEFGAVARLLSLSHPPGHPLHAVTTHFAQLAPLGDAALRANLASAVALAAALAWFHRLLVRLEPRLPIWATVCAALLPAAMPSIWLQAVRAEVYALQLVATVAIVDFGVRFAQTRDARWLAALALAFGCAGANHSLVGAALLPFGLAATVVGRPNPRAVVAAALAGLGSLAAYAYLPLRADAGGVVGWGRPVTAARIWATISGREWQGNLTAAPGEVDIFDNAASVVAYGIDQVGLASAAVLTVVLFLGFPIAFRARGRALAVAVSVVAPVVATRLFYDFDPLNPDIGGYFAAAWLALVAAIWIVCGAVAERWPCGRYLAWVWPAVLIAAVPRADPGGRRGSRTAERFARAALAEVPPGGAILYSDYASCFLGWYLRGIEGQRPDVAMIFRGQVHRDWYRERWAGSIGADQAERAEWADPLVGYPDAFRLASTRVEPGIELDRLGPLGASLQSTGLGTTPDAAPLSDESLTRVYDRISGPGAGTLDLDARRALAFHHLQHALAVRGAPARWHIRRALTLAPGDPIATAALDDHLSDPDPDPDPDPQPRSSPSNVRGPRK